MNVVRLFESRFVRLFDLVYAPGKHYYDASRREEKDLVALKSDGEFRSMTPDAVSCFVVVDDGVNAPALLLSREYRYPAGRYLLSVPAGLIDPEDEREEQPLFSAAKREIFEETGVRVTDADRMSVINPCVFSTPGMTDESNALVGAVLTRDVRPELTHSGAVGSEKFDGFLLADEETARGMIASGADDRGIYYPLHTYAALLYFLSGAWRSSPADASGRMAVR